MPSSMWIWISFYFCLDPFPASWDTGPTSRYLVTERITLVVTAETTSFVLVCGSVHRPANQPASYQQPAQVSDGSSVAAIIHSSGWSTRQFARCGITSKVCSSYSTHAAEVKRIAYYGWEEVDKMFCRLECFLLFIFIFVFVPVDNAILTLRKSLRFKVSVVKVNCCHRLTFKKPILKCNSDAELHEKII